MIAILLGPTLADVAAGDDDAPAVQCDSDVTAHDERSRWRWRLR